MTWPKGASWLLTSTLSKSVRSKEELLVIRHVPVTPVDAVSISAYAGADVYFSGDPARILIADDSLRNGCTS